jgi:hypothetical protein
MSSSIIINKKTDSHMVVFFHKTNEYMIKENSNNYKKKQTANIEYESKKWKNAQVIFVGSLEECERKSKTLTPGSFLISESEHENEKRKKKKSASFL